MSDIERKICEKVVDGLLEAGLAISVWEGEDWAITNSLDRQQVLDAMFSTDMDTLWVLTPEGRHTSVTLVYGNGEDVIADYGMLIEPYLRAAADYVESLS